MADPKPLASLTAGLLARKGQAKPAMRPGGAPANNGYDDLGWNDMGTDQRAVSAKLPAAAAVPDVVRQQAEVMREFGTHVTPPTVEFAEASYEPSTSLAEPEPAPIVAPVVTIAPILEESVVTPISRARGLEAGKAKAAFTLRLDADRHLRLRLACAVSHRSAQQIVTEALDALLSKRPDLDALAESLPVHGTAGTQ